MQCSNNKHVIYAGKEELKILEMEEKSCRLLNKGKNVAPFIDLKLLPNGYLIVHEEETLDLVMYDPEMREVKRLPRTTMGQNPFRGTYKTIKHGNSDSYYGWYVGNSALNLVDTSTFNFSTINGFFGAQSESNIPYAVVTSQKNSKVAGIYINNTSGVEHFAVANGSGTVGRQQVPVVLTHTRSSGLSNVEPSAKCIETNLDETILFVGGSSNSDTTAEAPIVFALTYNNNVTEVDQIDLSAGGKYTGPICAIKRFSGKNVFLAAGRRFAMIVEWTGSHLCLLNIIEDAHTGNNLSLRRRNNWSRHHIKCCVYGFSK